MSISPVRALALTALVALCCPLAAKADLTVGSKAPKLDIEHWVSTNEGKFPKINTFEPNKVYIVEFWATWCGPCVASMPHIAKLQKDYLDKGVQVISVSDEDLADVEKFLDRNVPNSQADAEGNKPTFRQLTSGYCLTTDPDQSVYRDYMEAAGEGGIPTAFIVGKDGVIEWIGHPMEMDEPLAKVVEGKWDRQAYIKERQERKMLEEELQKISVMMENGKPEDALKRIEELQTKVTNPEFKAFLEGIRVQLMVMTNPAEAAKQMKALIEKTNEAAALNALGWQIVEMSMQGQNVPKELIETGMIAAEKAVKLEPKDGAILDTLAHLVELKGDLDKAIQLQKKAVELAPEMRELKAYLKQLEDKKAEGAEK